MKVISFIGMVAVIGCISASSYAQPAPIEYNLKVKHADVDKIGKGLGTLPFNDVADLIASLRQQVIEQQQVTQVPKADGGNKEEKK